MTLLLRYINWLQEFYNCYIIFQRLQGKGLMKRRMTYIEMILILNVSHSIFMDCTLLKFLYLIVVQKDKQGGDVEVSSIEMLARQRDYKRRRQTYRAKNVHITKRSTVEVRVKLYDCNMHTLREYYVDFTLLIM